MKKFFLSGAALCMILLSTCYYDATDPQPDSEASPIRCSPWEPIEPVPVDPPESALLFGHDNVNHSIVQIDTVTGLATLVGPTTFNSGASGMATSTAIVEGPGGELYASGTHFGLLRDNTLNLDFVVAVDLLTGAATKVVQTERLISGRGVSFAADGSTLYLIEGNLLSTINIATGSVTEIGSINPYSAVSLDYDPDTDLLYSIAGSTLISIDPATAAPTLIKAAIGASACTLAYSPAGTWYSVDNNTGNLFSIDINTGDITMIGNLGLAASASICGTAFAIERPISVEIPVDIKPMACPNYLNINRTGGMFVSIVGTETFDVTQVDIHTITLEGIPLLLAPKVMEVATPYEPYTGKTEATDCHKERYDGIPDLYMEFDRVTLITALESKLGRPLEKGETLVLRLSALLLDGTPLVGEDVMYVVLS